ncbi:glucokinase [Rhabdobacter roseus]|uniref:Glucokinase n=1 Tax=Rhabdobacter roseus TaxID=1655419 RepID=A0A840TP61_9BACT|nr:ROK family protein [Rhabdobacter roseus]MBB5285531.1 glucokinase [Rhabdobacter roseus]
MAFIGIDLGGTNVKGILIDQSGEMLRQHYLPTQEDADGAWRDNVRDMVKYLQNYWQKPLTAIGLSAPGLPNAQNSCITFMPGRLPGLEGFEWSTYLGLPTYVLNDAHAALMAEATFGQAQHCQHALLLTLGTGVGGGILIRSELYQGLGQMAGHLGHISVQAHDDERSVAGMPGSLEYAIGNYSVARRSHGRFSSTWELVEAYRRGDPLASYVWLSSVKALAVAIASLSNALSPERVILAGGITLADDALFEPLRAFLDVYEWRPGGIQTEVVQAQFGDMAGAIGAAGFARKQHVG